MEDFECPVENCEECDYHRSQSWCARAIPINKDDGPTMAHKIYMEGFWEAFEFAYQEYQILEELLNKYEEITHCEDCEYYQGDHEYCYNDMFAKEGGYCHHAKPRENR